MPRKKKKHDCRKHWHWEQIWGMRVSREIDGRYGYNVRCGVCGRVDFVDEKGKPVKVRRTP